MKRCRWMLCLLTLWLWGMPVSAAGFTQEQYEEWQADGTWEERVAFMKEIEESRAQQYDVLNYSSEADSWNDLADWNAKRASMPTTGEAKALVFLVEFQDFKNDEVDYTADSVKKQLFGQTDDWTVANGLYNGSLTDYYQEASFEQLTITGDVYGWYTASGKREDYANGVEGREKLLKEVLTYYEQQIDFSQYDADDDGVVDAIYLNYAGGTDDWGEQWWNYQANWYGLDGEFAVDQKLLQGYVFLGEQYISDNKVNENFTITAIHETGHLLGLPDYYDYDFGIGEGGGLGGVDMMDCNVGDHNPLSKLMLGWIDEKQVQFVELGDEFKEYELKPFSESGELLVVAKEWNGSFCSEYYLVEYYTNDNLNQGLIDTEGGLRIWHVNAQLNEWETDFVYDNSYSTYKLLKLYEADGKETIASVGLFRGIYVNDEDLYHTTDELYYGSYPNSDYYGKVFSGIHIKVGEMNADVFQVLVKQDEINPDEPQLVGARPEANGDGILKSGWYSKRWLEIEFDNTFSIADESKISVVTLSGAEASVGEFVIGAKKLLFPVYGDSTTKAIIKFEPGAFSNSSGVANTWTYSYEINHMYTNVEENERLAFLNYGVFSAVTGTCYDAEKDVMYAAVSCLNNELYWVSVSADNVMTKTKLADSAQFYYVGEPIALGNENYMISFHGESTCDILFFKEDGTVLNKYISEHNFMDEYVISQPTLMPDDTIGFVEYMNGLWYHKLSLDENCQFTEEKYFLSDAINEHRFPSIWFEAEGRLFGTSWKENEYYETGEELRQTTQKLAVWEVADKKVCFEEIVLSKQQGVYPLETTCIVDDGENYLLFGVCEGPDDGNGYKDAVICVLRINKEDLSVIDYVEVCRESVNSDTRAVRIVEATKVTDDEYIIQITADITENSLNFTPYRPTSFYVGLDGSFNISWVQVSPDTNVKSLLMKDAQDMVIFAHNTSVFEQGCYQLIRQGRQMAEFTIVNNLSEEKVVEKAVVGGRLRYIIPQMDGYEVSQILVNGTETAVHNDVLVCESVLKESGANTVQIIYEQFGLVTEIEFDKETLELEVAETATLAVTIKTENAINKEIEWMTSDSSVAIVDSNGKVTAISAGTATITATAVDGSGVSKSCLVTVTEPIVFDDIESGAYYEAPVQWAVANGITNGYGSTTTFCPDLVCTRGQIVTFLWRAKGCPEPASLDNPFTDVATDAYYYKAVLWAVEQGITNGYGSDTIFNPDGECTRGQVATFMWRAEGNPANSGSNPFVDLQDGAYYYDAVLWAVEKGVTNGYGSVDTFCPDIACTRGQIVTFLYRGMK